MITFPDCFGHSDAIFLFRGSGQNKWCQMTYAIYGVITRVQQRCHKYHYFSLEISLTFVAEVGNKHWAHDTTRVHAKRR